MALVVSIIFGFALFTYAFNAYAAASRRQMNILREKYEAMATKNAILAFAQVYNLFKVLYIHRHIHDDIFCRGLRHQAMSEYELSKGDSNNKLLL